MIKVGKEYRVFKGELAKSGEFTKFSVSESNKNQATGQWEVAGWWTIVVKGRYPCDRNDMVRIILTQIEGVSRADWNGKTYTTIFAKANILNYKGQNVVQPEDAPEEFAGGYPF